MVGFLKKNIDGAALDVDTSSRSVKVAIASMGNLDRQNDVIAKGAFNRTINQRGPKGSNEIWHLVDHTPTMATALGKFSDLYVEGDKLVGISNYKDSYLWREVVWPLYAAGDINQHSIGFSIEDEETLKDGTRIIKTVALWEGSAVLWGANPVTPTLEVSKSIGIYNEDDELPVKIEKMIKRLKSDSFCDDDKSLFAIELRQLQQAMLDAEKQATPTVEETPAPVKGIDWNAVALKLYS